MSRYRIQESSAPRIRKWIAERGGVNVWDSADLRDPGKEGMVPVRSEDGKPTEKPHWSCGKVVWVLTKEDEVEVVGKRLVKRFHVGVRLGDQGMRLKLTDAASRRVRAEKEKAGEGSWHEFDYECQDALIFAQTAPTPLEQWVP